MKVFVGIVLSDHEKETLARVLATYREALSPETLEAQGAMKWVVPQNYHCTLRFIGEMGKAEVEDLKGQVGQALEGHSPFELQVDRAGFFQKKNQGILWFGASETCVGLDQVLIGLGVTPEDFVSHITVARGPIRWIEAAAQVLTLQMKIEVKTIAIFESVSSPQGVQYIPLHTYPLTK